MQKTPKNAENAKKLTSTNRLTNRPTVSLSREKISLPLIQPSTTSPISLSGAKSPQPRVFHTAQNVYLFSGLHPLHQVALIFPGGGARFPSLVI